MKRITRAVAIAGLALAGVFVLLAVASWPPGGLLFAFPYVSLAIATLLGLPSAIALILTRTSRASAARQRDVERH